MKSIILIESIKTGEVVADKEGHPIYRDDPPEGDGWRPGAPGFPKSTASVGTDSGNATGEHPKGLGIGIRPKP